MGLESGREWMLGPVSLETSTRVRTLQGLASRLRSQGVTSCEAPAGRVSGGTGGAAAPLYCIDSTALQRRGRQRRRFGSAGAAGAHRILAQRAPQSLSGDACRKGRQVGAWPAQASRGGAPKAAAAGVAPADRRSAARVGQGSKDSRGQRCHWRHATPTAIRRQGPWLTTCGSGGPRGPRGLPGLAAGRLRLDRGVDRRRDWPGAGGDAGRTGPHPGKSVQHRQGRKGLKVALAEWTSPGLRSRGGRPGHGPRPLVGTRGTDRGGKGHRVPRDLSPGDSKGQAAPRHVEALGIGRARIELHKHPGKRGHRKDRDPEAGRQRIHYDIPRLERRTKAVRKCGGVEDGGRRHAPEGRTRQAAPDNRHAPQPRERARQAARAHRLAQDPGPDLGRSALRQLRRLGGRHGYDGRGLGRRFPLYGSARRRVATSDRQGLRRRVPRLQNGAVRRRRVARSLGPGSGVPRTVRGVTLQAGRGQTPGLRRRPLDHLARRARHSQAQPGDTASLVARAGPACVVEESTDRPGHPVDRGLRAAQGRLCAHHTRRGLRAGPGGRGHGDPGTRMGKRWAAQEAGRQGRVGGGPSSCRSGPPPRTLQEGELEFVAYSTLCCGCELSSGGQEAGSRESTTQATATPR